MTPGLAESSPLAALVINFTYIAYPAFGVIGTLLGIFYGRISYRMSRFAAEATEIENRKNEAKLAGQRVIMSKGEACRLQHLVEKAYLEGVEGIINCHGPDSQGLVSVLVQGKEVKVEEFQLGVAVKGPGELEERKTMGSLRAAELQHKFEQWGTSIAIQQMIYVTIGQVLIGFLVMAIVMLLLNVRFNAIAVYREVTRQIITNFERRMYFQKQLCSAWQNCFEGESRPTFCGACTIPRPSRYPPEVTQRKTFFGTSIFEGDSFLYIIIFGSVGAACGLIFGYIIMRCVCKARRGTTFCISLVIAVIFGVVGAAAAPFPVELSEQKVVADEHCSARDIDPIRPGVQEVSLECLSVLSAYSASHVNERSARLSVTGCLVNNAFFLFESLSFLSLSIRARGPNDWARFEVQVFLYYFSLVACVMLGGNAVYSYTDIFPYLQEFYESNTQFAAAITEGTSDFPLAISATLATWAFARQGEIGASTWYYFEIMVPFIGIVFLIQLIALLFATFAREEIWVRALRAVLIVDMLIIFSVYSSVAFMSLVAANLVHNLLAISIIPLCVQVSQLRVAPCHWISSDARACAFLCSFCSQCFMQCSQTSSQSSTTYQHIPSSPASFESLG